jgi:S-methylmethionine-dependent homocysteine/selenocysteine methylase
MDATDLENTKHGGTAGVPPYGLRTRLYASSEPIILDGAMGTELLRRGVRTDLPLWSAPANVKQSEIVYQIHADHVSAGAELITTNTFRTSLYAMERSPFRAEWEQWNAQAIRLARRAAGERAWILGSVTTLEDCYRPDLVPGHTTLAYYHRQQIDLLAGLQVDGILLETFNTLRELDAAYFTARRHRVPVLASVVLNDGAHLYDGTPLSEVAHWTEQAKPDVLAINCTSPEATDGALRYLREAIDLPLGAYANVGRPGGEMGFEFTHAYSAAKYARWATRWARMGVQLLGGCCGATPDYIRALAQSVRMLDPKPTYGQP